MSTAEYPQDPSKEDLDKVPHFSSIMKYPGLMDPKLGPRVLDQLKAIPDRKPRHMPTDNHDDEVQFVIDLGPVYKKLEAELRVSVDKAEHALRIECNNELDRIEEDFNRSMEAHFDEIKTNTKAALTKHFKRTRIALTVWLVAITLYLVLSHHG